MAIVTEAPGLVGVLQRGRCVEEITTPQHRPIPRGTHQTTTIRDHLRLDGK